MNPDAKKTALRMIPYGLYVLTADHEGAVGAATVNWVTQASFAPPLVVVGVKADSGVYAALRQARAFALNVLGKGQQAIAFAFFKPTVREGDRLNGEVTRPGSTGAPLLDRAPAFVECRVTEIVERGDHAIVIGEVVEAGVREEISGRPDAATLWLQDLGEKTFYGG